MHATLPARDIVLLGIGHTNAHVLRMWKMQPIDDVRLTCVSNFAVSTYSGMLPGVLAGQYPPQRMQIDLVRLCAAAGARFVNGDVTGLNVDGRQLVLADRPPIPFDVLSVGVGSIPKREGVESDELLLPIKPMQSFVCRFEERLQRLSRRIAGRPLHVVVVGGGAGGVEITYCLPARVASVLGDVPVEITLAGADDTIAGGMRPQTVQLVRKELEGRGVRLLLGRRAVRIIENAVTLDNGDVLDADLVLWATSAAAPPLLSRMNLPLDDEGFLLTDASLQTTAGAPVFAVGDCGTIQSERTPKAGVYAVRQGPVLWHNIRRLLDGKPLKPYEPQRGFLKLLNTGDGRAIGEYKAFSFSGKWCWRLKDWIDGRFMDKYQDYEPMEMSARPRAEDSQMRCAGCGCKVGGSLLARVLNRLDVPHSDRVVLGLDQPDDAAIVTTADGRSVAVTADFFTAPLDDPYLVGRIAALNAASDLFALGGRPTAALALLTVPRGSEGQQEQLLYDALCGALQEFRGMNATLVGGHTTEGEEFTIGFTVLGDQGNRVQHTKRALRAGDCLVLTKPLGTGVLLASHMRAACRAPWMNALLQTMLASNGPASALLDELDVSGVTDVTGFGLAGHLLEMLRASDLAAELDLKEIRLLPGVAELVGSGVESTLAPANRAAEADIRADEAQRSTPAYAALFDPQTSGGLLLAVSQRDVDDLLRRLSEQSDIPAAVVGQIAAHQPGEPRIKLAPVSSGRVLNTTPISPT